MTLFRFLSVIFIKECHTSTFVLLYFMRVVALVTIDMTDLQVHMTWYYGFTYRRGRYLEENLLDLKDAT